MNLPKYIPGLTVIVRQDENSVIYPEGYGMFVIATAFIDHEEWHYETYDGKIQVHESEIVGIINNGYYVEAERFNGVERAPDQAPAVADEFEKLMETQTEDEKNFIKKTSKREKSPKKKIEVKDGDDAK